MYFFRICLIPMARFNVLVFRALLSTNSLTNHVRISLFKTKVHIQNSQQKSNGQALTFSPVSTCPAKVPCVYSAQFLTILTFFLPFREQRAIYPLVMGILAEISY